MKAPGSNCVFGLKREERVGAVYAAEPPPGFMFFGMRSDNGWGLVARAVF